MEAGTACIEYERWAAEMARLTAAIGNESCPIGLTKVIELDMVSGSCFERATRERTDADNWIPGHGNRPLNLDEIEEEVESCESCTRLVHAIRARKHARQRFGVAKRLVRLAGKQLRAAEGGE